MAKIAEYRPRDRSGESVEKFGVGAQQDDYFFEYGVGYSPRVYEVASGELRALPLSVQHLVAEGHIGKAIEKRASDLGALAGAVFEIRGGEARQVGNVEGNRFGARITWSPSRADAATWGGGRAQNFSRRRNPGELRADPRMRMESKYKLGERGAVYEFNVKFHRGDYSADVSDDAMYVETDLAVRAFADVLRDRYPWIGDVHLKGRSGGWLAVEDKQGKATREAIEEIADLTDDARKEFGKYLDEEYGGSRRKRKSR